MSKIKITIIVLIMTAVAFCQNRLAFALRNPFESQLPKKKIEIVVEPKKGCLAHGWSRSCNEITETCVERIAENGDPCCECMPKEINKDQNNQQTDIELPNLEIVGLIWNSDRPQAIVNGKVIDIGDTVEGVEIVNITKKGVEVKFQGQQVTINSSKGDNP